MKYNVVYLEDQDAKSVIHDLLQYDLNVIHCNPTSFKETIEEIDSHQPDLILMDFRLMEGGGDVNAPAFAQHYRSLIIDDKTKSMPIVLLSNDDRIHGYYQDYTSHDLFDFSINKSGLSKHLNKYTSLMKELIGSYQQISKLQSRGDPLVRLLNIPEVLADQIDPRVVGTLGESKFITNVYIASAFILDNIVKPIGILIGEDVLAARIGIDNNSPDWASLCEKFEGYEYVGIYSDTYKRWWSEGVEIWWHENIAEKSQLRRISSTDKAQLLKSKFPSLELKVVEGDIDSITKKFWSICDQSLVPVDPSEAYEAKTELATMPWIDRKYFSYRSIRSNLELMLSLTDIEKNRFKQLAKG
jgi:CheY-like chemotaxis protein